MSPRVKSLMSSPAGVRLVLALAVAATIGTGLPQRAQAAGTVTVNWLQPEQYSDAGRGPMERERTLKTLSETFESLGRDLPDGQTLKIEVLDLDLAGELRLTGTRELRVLRGRADWPHMALRYILSEGGQTLRSGEARLDDMNYLQNLQGREALEGGLPYERHMVRHWFEETFPHPKP